MTIDLAMNNLSGILTEATEDEDSVCYVTEDDAETLQVAMEIMRKYQQLEDFAKWVAVEVIDEELWTYNHLAFAEIACRKLVRLGIMQESDGEYTYEVLEDGNDD